MTRTARLLDLSLLFGEAAWLSGLVLLFGAGLGEPDPMRLLTLIIIFSVAGYLLASYVERLEVIGVDRWAMAGAGIVAALLAPALAGVDAELLSPIGATFWLGGVVVWARGVYVSGDPPRFSMVGVSFVIGFGAMALSLVVPLGEAIPILIPVSFAVSFLAAFALATLNEAANQSESELGGEWLATTLGVVAGVLALTVILLGTIGRLVEPLLRGLVDFLAATVGAALVWVLSLVAYVIGVIGEWILLNLLQPIMPDFEERVRPEVNEGPFDPSQLASSLPDWVTTVVQVVLIATIVASVVIAIALLYRRRARSGRRSLPGVRSSVYQSGALREDLLGWWRGFGSGGEADAWADPMHRFGDDGRWLRARFIDLRVGMSARDDATPLQIATLLAARAPGRPLAPIATSFERARFGLIAPEPAEMADLKRRWEEANAEPTS